MPRQYDADTNEVAPPRQAPEEVQVAQAEAQHYDNDFLNPALVGVADLVNVPRFVPQAPPPVLYDTAAERRKMDEWERRKLDLGDADLAELRLDLLRLAHKSVATMPNKDQVDIKQLAKEFEEFVLRGRKS